MAMPSVTDDVLLGKLLGDLAQVMTTRGVEHPDVDQFVREHAGDHPEFAELATVSRRIKTALSLDASVRVNADPPVSPALSARMTRLAQLINEGGPDSTYVRLYVRQYEGDREFVSLSKIARELKRRLAL